jgi:hypothetical protein
MVHTAPFFSIRIIEFSPFDFFNFMATAEQALLEYGCVDKRRRDWSGVVLLLR